MSVSVSTADGGRVAHVVLAGEHDVASAHELSKAFLACSAEPVQVVVVDAGPCTFADSTVLGALVNAYQRMTSRGGRFVVINAAGPLAKLLSITKLDEVLLAPVGFEP